jgi:hypothetical protein
MTRYPLPASHFPTGIALDSGKSKYAAYAQYWAKTDPDGRLSQKAAIVLNPKIMSSADSTRREFQRPNVPELKEPGAIFRHEYAHHIDTVSKTFYKDMPQKKSAVDALMGKPVRDLTIAESGRVISYYREVYEARGRMSQTIVKEMADRRGLKMGEFLRSSEVVKNFDGYATSNNREFFAEGFAVITTKKTLTPIQKEFKDLFDREYKKLTEKIK